VTEEGEDSGEKGPSLRAGWRGPSAPSEDNDYPKGFEDGVRNALREILSYIVKGHSANEIRLLAETRLAHMEEETMERRKSLVVSPRRLPIDSLMPVVAQSNRSAGEKVATPMMNGYSYLFQEKTPTQAREFLGRVLEAGLPVVAMTRLPQELSALCSKGMLTVLRIDEGATEDSKGENSVGVRSVDANPSFLTGAVTRFQEKMGPRVGAYLDAFDYLESEYGYENAIRFVHWLNTLAQKQSGVLIVSTDPEGLDNRKMVQLRSDFNIKR
jgi:hypothetical protein